MLCLTEYQVEHTLVLMVDALGVCHVMDGTRMMIWHPKSQIHCFLSEIEEKDIIYLN